MFGERLAARREQVGLSQTDLARIIGISPSRISDFERGAKTDCNLSTAKRLARALGCSIDYLAGTWDEEAETALAAAPAAAGAPVPTGRRRGRPRAVAPPARTG